MRIFGAFLFIRNVRIERVFGVKATEKDSLYIL